MMRVAKYYIHIGQSISVDEMDISFQGRHKDKQRVTYKKGGDGFLVDDICAEGYTYSWHFINQLASICTCISTCKNMNNFVKSTRRPFMTNFALQIHF